LFCTNCGHKSEGTESFCMQCGTKLEGASGGNGGGSGVSFQQLKLLGVLGGVLVILIIFIVVLTGRDTAASTPEEAGERFMDAYMDLDMGEVFDLIDPQEIEKAKEDMDMDMDELKDDFLDDFADEMELMENQLKEMEAEGISLEYELGEVEDENGTAWVEMKSTYHHPDEEEPYRDSRELKVVERDGDWYITPEVLNRFFSRPRNGIN